MSRLWNRPRLCVFVGEEQLAICRVAGRWRARVLDKDCVPLAKGEGALATALDAWLAAHPVTPGTPMEFAMGLPHVRYLLLPWNEELVQAPFRDALARALYARQFQDELATQEVRYGAASYGQPLLAACLDRSLVAGLSAVAARHGLKTSCVEPLLAAVTNGFRPELRRLTGMLVIEDASRILVVRQHKGVIVELSIRPGSGTDVVMLAQRLAVESACKVFAPRQPALAGSLPRAWLEPVSDGVSGVKDGAYAYALCGVR